MARPVLQLQATEEEVLELGRLVRGTKVSVGDRFRAKIVLLRLEGRSETEVARTLGCSMGSVCKWSKRFDGYGIAGLKDALGRGRKARLPAEKISLIVERATRPAKGRVRWSVRSMAREAKVSKSTVQRVWSHNEIKPHRLETFKISNDPNFEEKFLGRHRALFGSARAGFSALLRREESVPSSGAHPTPPSSEEGLRTHPDP